jgi:trk/ktr system potassium uptake protein
LVFTKLPRAGDNQQLAVRLRNSVTLHLLGFALLAESAGLAISAGVAIVTDGRDVGVLVVSAVACLACGASAWRFTVPPTRITRRQTFVAVTLTWVGVCALGALPFLLSHSLGRMDDALFESVSGFTATGSTLLSPIEDSSRGVLFWRSMTQWYGGMGMIVLAVAALPLLGVGGYELLGAETPGPVPDRLAPRVSTTARRLWIIYVGITAFSAAALMLAGTSAYDGLVHAFTAVSTGGFSPYDLSVDHFQSLPVELILDVTMLLGATNFALHWVAIHGRPAIYWRSAEFRLFVAVVAGAIALVTILQANDGVAVGSALRDGSFNVISVITTTGFAIGDYELWVPAAQLILILLMITGSMSGSTSGAVKLFRLQVVFQAAAQLLRKVRHPHAVLVVRFDGAELERRTVESTQSFIVLYGLSIVLGIAAVSALGSDLLTAAGGVITAIGGVGPGLNESGPTNNFVTYSHPARMVLAWLMLVGRLEVYPVLIAVGLGSARLFGRRLS